MSNYTRAGVLRWTNASSTSHFELIPFTLSTLLPTPQPNSLLLHDETRPEDVLLVDEKGNPSAETVVASLDISYDDLRRGQPWKGYKLHRVKTFNLWSRGRHEARSDLGHIARFFLLATEIKGVAWISSLLFITESANSIAKLHRTLDTGFPFHWVTARETVKRAMPSIDVSTIDGAEMTPARSSITSARVIKASLRNEDASTSVTARRHEDHIRLEVNSHRRFVCNIRGAANECQDSTAPAAKERFQVFIDVRLEAGEILTIQVVDTTDNKLIWLGYLSSNELYSVPRGTHQSELLHVFHHGLHNWPTWVRIMAVNGHTEQVQRAFGALVPVRKERALSHVDQHGNTIMHDVASIGDSAMCQTLIALTAPEVMARVLAICNNEGLTASQVCARHALTATDAESIRLWRICEQTLQPSPPVPTISPELYTIPMDESASAPSTQSSGTDPMSYDVASSTEATRPQNTDDSDVDLDSLVPPPVRPESSLLVTGGTAAAGGGRKRPSDEPEESSAKRQRRSSRTQTTRGGRTHGIGL